MQSIFLSSIMKIRSSCPVLEVRRTQSFQKKKNLFVGVSSQIISKKRLLKRKWVFFRALIYYLLHLRQLVHHETQQAAMWQLLTGGQPFISFRILPRIYSQQVESFCKRNKISYEESRRSYKINQIFWWTLKTDMTSFPLKEFRKMFAKESWTLESKSCALKCTLRRLFPATIFFHHFLQQNIY